MVHLIRRSKCWSPLPCHEFASRPRDPALHGPDCRHGGNYSPIQIRRLLLFCYGASMGCQKDIYPWFTDIGKSFTDIGNSFTDISKWFTDIGKYLDLPISVNHLPISVIQAYLPISVNAWLALDTRQLDFETELPISVNSVIYRYRYIVLFTDIGKWFTDIGKWFTDIGKWLTDIGNSKPIYWYRLMIYRYQ